MCWRVIAGSIFFLFLNSILVLAASQDLKKMIKIPSGHFYMGKDDSSHSNEKPRHLVYMSSFFIDATLVTNAEFKKFVQIHNYITTAEKKGYGMVSYEGLNNWEWKMTPGSNWRTPLGPKSKRNFPSGNDYPVVSVSWHDADAYCKSLGKRLPTEAEWEYAARAGKSNVRFPWGDIVKRKSGKIGLNYWQGESHKSADSTDGYVYTSPVKAFPPNEWGIYDPVGNVWQWTADWYDPNYFETLAKGETHDPKGPIVGTKKVARGGSWWCSETTCSGPGLFFRGKALPDAVFNNNGFRCARN